MILINKSSGVFLIEFKCIKGVLRPKTWRTADLDQGTKGGGFLSAPLPLSFPQPAVTHRWAHWEEDRMASAKVTLFWSNPGLVRLFGWLAKRML